MVERRADAKLELKFDQPASGFILLMQGVPPALLGGNSWKDAMACLDRLSRHKMTWRV